MADEPTLRLRLQVLTYELTEAADRYNRLARERSKAISIVLRFSLAIVAMLLVGLVGSLNGLMSDPGPGVNDRQAGAGDAALSWVWLTPVLLAGGLGAMISIVPSTISEEKRRPVYASTYIWYMGVRAILGSVYAFIVYNATVAQVLPLTIPTDLTTAISFLTVLAFASGFSDRLFGQVLSGLITGEESSSEKKGSAGSGT